LLVGAGAAAEKGEDRLEFVGTGNIACSGFFGVGVGGAGSVARVFGTVRRAMVRIWTRASASGGAMYTCRSRRPGGQQGGKVRGAHQHKTVGGTDA